MEEDKYLFIKEYLVEAKEAAEFIMKGSLRAEGYRQCCEDILNYIWELEQTIAVCSDSREAEEKNE